MSDRFIDKIKPYLLVAPAMVGIALFTVWPVIRLIWLSFFKVNLLNSAKTKFVGLENYTKIFQMKQFIRTLKNTGTYSFWTILVTLGFAIILAVWLSSRQNKLSHFTQAAAFTPHIISTVSIGLVFAQMMNPTYGLFNSALTSLGLQKIQWLQSSDTAMGSVIFVAAWKGIGYYCLIIIGALQSIPASIYEAAALDDAGSFITLWKITMPLISPQLFFTLIVMTISSFKVFEIIRILTAGGPNYATNTLVYFIYQKVFSDYDIGKAAAAGVVLMVLVGAMTVVYFAALSKKVHYQ